MGFWDIATVGGDVLAWWEQEEYRKEQDERVAGLREDFGGIRGRLNRGQDISTAPITRTPGVEVKGPFGIGTGEFIGGATIQAYDPDKYPTERIPSIFELSRAGLAEADKVSGLAAYNVTEGLSLLEGYGDQAKADTRREYQNMMERELIDLQNRGFSGSLATNFRLGGLREREDAVARIDEYVQGLKSSSFLQTSTNQLATERDLLGYRDVMRAAPGEANTNLDLMEMQFEASRVELPPGQNIIQAATQWQANRAGAPSDNSGNSRGTSIAQGALSGGATGFMVGGPWGGLVGLGVGAGLAYAGDEAGLDFVGPATTVASNSPPLYGGGGTKVGSGINNSGTKKLFQRPLGQN